MILFTILLLTLFLIAVISIMVISVTGAVGIVLFGDVIICGFLIIKIMKWLVNRKKQK